MQGTIEAIRFTSGGAGNQWTTIDGTKYATYWSFDQGVEVGAVVEYETRMAPLWSGTPPVPHATILRVLT